jgi:high-affinity iron transporter
MGYGTIAVPDGSGGNGELTVEDVGYFAIPAFLITFREFLEAAIIIAVLLGILNKMDQPHLIKWVWLGCLSATLICLVMAVVFILLIVVLKEEFLTEESTLLVEGSISIIAAILIAVVASSIGNVMAINEKYEKRLGQQIADAEEDAGVGLTAQSIFFLSWSAVMREGIETIIFFTGIGAAYPAASLPIPAITGAIVGSACGVLLYKVGGRMTIKVFFIFTMVLLVFIGAGVFTNGVHSIQAANKFGEYIDEDNRTGLNKPLWDVSDCCGYESQFWIMMRVLFGWTPYPSGIEMIAYFSYHIVTCATVAVKYKFKTRKDEGMPALFYCGKRPCGGVAIEDQKSRNVAPVLAIEDPK